MVVVVVEVAAGVCDRDRGGELDAIRVRERESARAVEREDGRTLGSVC